MLKPYTNHFGSYASYFGLSYEHTVYKVTDNWKGKTEFDAKADDGHTAYELAVAMKRQELAKLVLKCSKSCISESFIRFIYSNLTACDHTTGSATDKGMRYTVQEASALLQQKEIDLNILDMKPFTISLQQCAFHLASRGELTWLQWLIHAWRLDPTFSEGLEVLYGTNQDTYGFLEARGMAVSLMNAVMMGPTTSYMMQEFPGVAPEEAAVQLNDAVNLLFKDRRWRKGDAIQDHMRNQAIARVTRKSEDESKYYVSYKVQLGDSDYLRGYVDRFIDTYLERIEGVYIEERLAVLSYLYDDLHLPLPSLVLVVSLGQHHVLAWIAARVDLTAPITTNKDLMIRVGRVPWMHSIDPGMSIASALCYYAAGLGEIVVMQWLLQRYNIASICRVRCKNLLHIATIHNRFPCVIWLVQYYPTLVGELTNDRQTVFHIALQCKHIGLTRFYMGLPIREPGLRVLWGDDSDGMGVYGHLARSKVPEFQLWVRKREAVTAVESIITLLDQRPLNSGSLEMLLAAVDFPVLTQIVLDSGDLFSALSDQDEYEGGTLDYDCIVYAYVGLFWKAVRLRRLDLVTTIVTAIYEYEHDNVDIARVHINTLLSTLPSAELSITYLDGATSADDMSYLLVPFVTRIKAAKEWRARWVTLCEDLSTAFISLSLEGTIACIRDQREWEVIKPASADADHLWSYDSFFHFISFTAVDDAHKSEFYPMTPLNYAISNDSEGLVHWLLGHPILRHRGSSMYIVKALETALVTAIVTNQRKYIDLILRQEWAWAASDQDRYTIMYECACAIHTQTRQLNDTLIMGMVEIDARDSAIDMHTYFVKTLCPNPLDHLVFAYDSESEMSKTRALLQWLLANPSIKGHGVGNRGSV